MMGCSQLHNTFKNVLFLCLLIKIFVTTYSYYKDKDTLHITYE